MTRSGGALTAPLPAAGSEVPVPGSADPTDRTVLSNGLTLLTRRDRSAAAVAIVTYVKAGYFDESDADVGIAHVL